MRARAMPCHASTLRDPRRAVKNKMKSETLLLSLWCANGFLNRNEGSVCLTDLSASTSPASTLCLVGDGVPFHLDLLTSASGSVAAVCEVPPPSLITLSSFLWDHFSLSSYSHRAAHSLISRTPRFGSQGNGKKTILAQTSLLRRSVDLYCLTGK
jgi:hypothetical protein